MQGKIPADSRRSTTDMEIGSPGRSFPREDYRTELRRTA